MVVHESDRAKSNARRESPGRMWPDWYPVLATLRNSDSRKGIWQLINSLVPYCCLWYLMIRWIQLGYSHTLALILALPAAAFLVRLFILFHDCVHGSFFMSKSANTFFGYFLGVLVFTSFEDWRFTYLRHHVTHANLDARGYGDIWTMTLKTKTSSCTTIRKDRVKGQVSRKIAYSSRLSSNNNLSICIA